MKKFVAPFAIALSALALVGAGCSQPLTEKNESAQPAETTNAATEASTPNDFKLTAESVGTGSVKLTWAAPNDFAKDSVFRLLHSANQNPVYPGAFWYGRPVAEKETVWSNIPVGARHFRACEYSLNQSACVRYSNDVTLEVK